MPNPYRMVDNKKTFLSKLSMEVIPTSLYPYSDSYHVVIKKHKVWLGRQTITTTMSNSGGISLFLFHSQKQTANWWEKLQNDCGLL